MHKLVAFTRLFPFCHNSSPLKHKIQNRVLHYTNRSISSGNDPSRILEQDEVEEYYEVEEEGVEVDMVADREPYLRDDLPRRPLGSLTIDELVQVLRDQRAKSIISIKMSELQHSTNPYVIVCSPYNPRHGKALETVLRAFLKRNFIFKSHADIPRRRDGTPGWYILDMNNVTVHIVEEETRRRYDLESLYLGLDDDDEAQEGFIKPSWKHEYRVPDELLIKSFPSKSIGQH